MSNKERPSIWAISPAHSETAAARARRDYRMLLTGTVRVVVWCAACNVVVVGVTSYLSWGHARDAQVAIGVGALVAGLVLSFSLPYGALWVTAPVRQRNEARIDLLTRPTVLQMIDGLSELLVAGNLMREAVEATSWDCTPSREHVQDFHQWKADVAEFMSQSSAWQCYAGFRAARTEPRVSDGRAERAQHLARWNAHISALESAITELRGRMY